MNYDYILKISSKLNNNTVLILKYYADLIIHKVILVIIPLIGISNIFNNIFDSSDDFSLIYLIRIITIIYVYINLFIIDTILRQSLKIRTTSKTEHSCDYCSINITWNLQDIISNLLFNIIGCMIFKYNWIMDIYWRSYIHSLPMHIVDKLCVQKSLEITKVGILFGIINYFSDYILGFVFNKDVCMIINLFLTFVFDFIVFNYYNNYDDFEIDFEIYENSIEKNEKIYYHIKYIFNLPLFIVWKTSQFIFVGYIEINKRNTNNRNIIKDLLWIANHLRNNIYYKFILWKEFQSLENFIKFGKVSLFCREHVISFYDLMVHITNYLNNTTFKIVRKSKIIHLTFIFKTFLPSQYKFYISLFESRKNIEQFINVLMNDLETSIKNTKGDIEYEEIFSYKNIEKKNFNMIDDYY
jgi:hypothetical protein